MSDTLKVKPCLSENVQSAVQKLLDGVLDDEAFKPLRLSVGAHRQRQGDGYMVRVRIPGGRLAVADWVSLAEVAGRWARRGHLTLRQDVQLYGVRLRDLPRTVAELSSLGLYTYASGGSTVRNITSAILGDTLDGPDFDPYPYAAGLSDRLSRHPLFNALPRKFKIGFAGAGPEAAQGWLNDLGFFPVISDGRRGFRVVAGGGLGASPQSAFELETFIPVEHAGPYAEAALEYFSVAARTGKPAGDRFKFILRAKGVAAVRGAILGRLAGKPLDPEIRDLGAPGGAAAWIEAPQGDLGLDQLSGLGRALVESGAKEVRISFDQRLFVPGLTEEPLQWLLAAALGLGLEASEVPAAVRLVVCAGPDTCNRGLVNSKALAMELGGMELPADLHVSGCQNGCSQHLRAPISLQGTVRSTPKGRQPCYLLRAASRVGSDGISFGPALISIPARRVRRSLERLSAEWKMERDGGLHFEDWLVSQPKTAIEGRLRDILDGGEDSWLDVGSGQVFEVSLGGSECH